MLPDMVAENNWTPHEAGSLISYIGFANTIGRCIASKSSSPLWFYYPHLPKVHLILFLVLLALYIEKGECFVFLFSPFGHDTYLCSCFPFFVPKEDEVIHVEMLFVIHLHILEACQRNAYWLVDETHFIGVVTWSHGRRVCAHVSKPDDDVVCLVETAGDCESCVGISNSWRVVTRTLGLHFRLAGTNQEASGHFPGLQASPSDWGLDRPTPRGTIRE